MIKKTKSQQKRRERYQSLLAACGFRSWKKANRRRCDLIELKIYERITPDETTELKRLQKLCGLYVTWKTNDSIGRQNRILKRQLENLRRSRK